jgi:serine/threonine protein kinase
MHSTRINVRLYLVTQLSNALTYLESENILHRDIAARNCLVFSNYELKLTNVAITCEHFHSHYYSINQCRLPMRWMAPECFADVRSKYRHLCSLTGVLS